MNRHQVTQANTRILAAMTQPNIAPELDAAAAAPACGKTTPGAVPLMCSKAAGHAGYHRAETIALVAPAIWSDRRPRRPRTTTKTTPKGLDR